MLQSYFFRFTFTHPINPVFSISGLEIFLLCVFRQICMNDLRFLYPGRIFLRNSKRNKIDKRGKCGRKGGLQ